MKPSALKVTELKSAIARDLGVILEKEGFVYKKTNNQFVCVQGDYTYVFNMLVTGYSDSTIIEVRLFICHKKIERIYARILGRSDKRTLGNDIGIIFRSPDGRQVINASLSISLVDSEDVGAAVESLERYYFDIAKPYFDRYTSLEAFDNILNNPPFTHSPAHVGGNLAERCIRGLIVARLVNNPNYEKLGETYDEEVKSTMQERSIENYFKVREYLMYNRIG